MGSTRLPGKVMMPVKGKPLLYYLINQVKHCTKLSKIVIATTTLQEDDDISDYVKSLGLDVYRGSSTDVLDRYYNCAKKYEADTIVRISGDSPLIDHNIIDKCIIEFEKNNFDYLSNTVTKRNDKWEETYNGYPLGFAVEVFSFDALNIAWNNAKEPSDREHVTEYIWKNPKIFKIGSIKNKEDLSHIRLVVDYQKDFEKIKDIIENFEENQIFTLKQIIEKLKFFS